MNQIYIHFTLLAFLWGLVDGIIKEISPQLNWFYRLIITEFIYTNIANICIYIFSVENY
jgi:hypothetical protein